MCMYIYIYLQFSVYQSLLVGPPHLEHGGSISRSLSGSFVKRYNGNLYVDQSQLRNCSPFPLNYIQDDGWLNIDLTCVLNTIGWES